MQEQENQHSTCSEPVPSINTAPDITMKRSAPDPCSPRPAPGSAGSAPLPSRGEYIMLVGGPSLMVWEKYKGEAAHDHWWANFIRAARIRTEQIRTQAGPDAKITWLVYGPGYKDRAQQEKQDLFASSVPCATSST